MKSKIRDFCKSGGTIAFITGFFLYIIIMLPIMINDGGIVMFMGDYSTQSVPFTYHIRDCLLSGDICWDWSNGLGSQFLSDYAFYNLFSPFSLLYLIVPRNLIIYFMPYVTAIKYGTGSCLAYFYVKRFVKNKHFAVIAGIIYMFSSFSGYNIIFHFTDVIALFPLLLIAMEELCVNKRRCVFAVTVCFMALLNYYFFAGQAVFCIIYFFVRFFDRNFVKQLKKLLSVAIEAVIGFAMSFAFLLPVFISLFQSNKAVGLIEAQNMAVYDSIYDYLKIIQSAFMIPDEFYFTSLFPAVSDTYPFGTLGASVAAYLPLFSAAGVISFAAARKKSWQTIVMIVCVVMAFVPVLNQLFSALNSAYYARWLYMPLLIASVMSLSALEEKVSFKPGIICCAVAVGAMLIYQITQDTDKLIRELSSRSYFSSLQNYLHFAVTVISLVILIIVVKSRRDKDYIPKLYIFSVICVYMSYGVMAQFLYSGIPDNKLNIRAAAFNENMPQVCRDDDERIAFRNENYNMIWKADGMSHFNSLHDKGFFQFLSDSGLSYDTGIFDDINITHRALCDLTSVKYYFAVGDNQSEYAQMQSVGKMGDYTVYLNPDFIPMGFVYDSMISRDAFLAINDDQTKERTYLKALIVDDTSEFSDILTDMTDTAGEAISDSEYEKLISDRRNGAAYYCKKTSDGLTAGIELEKENIVFFSASYNEGWSAYVDGEKTDVYNVNNGCIGVKVPEGRHEIRLQYTVRGFTEGIVITVVSVGILMLYAAVCRRKDVISERSQHNADSEQI